MSKLLTELCQLAVKMTNDFKRPISIYRLPDGKILKVFSYIETDDRWICLTTGDVCDEKGDVSLFLFPDSRKFQFYFMKNRSGKEIYRKSLPEKDCEYFGPDVRKKSQPFNMLNFFLKLFKKPGLVRVDPYDHAKVLTEEETKADLFIAGSCAQVERFEEGLKGVKLKPGIITPGEASRVNN